MTFPRKTQWHAPLRRLEMEDRLPSLPQFTSKMQIENHKSLVSAHPRYNNFLLDSKGLSKKIVANSFSEAENDFVFAFSFISSVLCVFLQGSAVFQPVVLGNRQYHDADGGVVERQSHHKRRVVSEPHSLSAQDVLFS